MLEAVNQYVEAAIQHGRCTESGNYRDGNRAHARIIAALSELRASPDQGEQTLIDLTMHQDNSVRSWSAAHLLPLNEGVALAVLEEVARGSGQVAFAAGITLQEWRAGRLPAEVLMDPAKSRRR